MAYTVARVKIYGWRDRFKEAENDTDFEVDSYPELDEYLSMMEQRGWTVVDTAVSSASNGTGVYLLVTLHRPDA